VFRTSPDGRRLGGRRLQHLYIGGNVNGLDVGELANLVLLDPGKEVTGGPVIGHASVFVADGGSEELNEPPRGMVAGAGDHSRHGQRAPQRLCLDRRRQVAPFGAHGDTL
jgi:hypothetical protein